MTAYCHSGISSLNWPRPKTNQQSHHEHVPIHHWCPDSWGCAKLVELHARDAVRLWAFRKHPRIPAKKTMRIILAYSQSRCFFLGPLTSCVVALQTALLMADPVMLCWAAAMRSVMDCPDIFIQLWDTKNQPLKLDTVWLQTCVFPLRS